MRPLSTDQSIRALRAFHTSAAHLLLGVPPTARSLARKLWAGSLCPAAATLSALADLSLQRAQSACSSILSQLRPFARPLPSAPSQSGRKQRCRYCGQQSRRKPGGEQAKPSSPSVVAESGHWSVRSPSPSPPRAQTQTQTKSPRSWFRRRKEDDRRHSRLTANRTNRSGADIQFPSRPSGELTKSAERKEQVHMGQAAIARGSRLAGNDSTMLLSLSLFRISSCSHQYGRLPFVTIGSGCGWSCSKHHFLSSGASLPVRRAKLPAAGATGRPACLMVWPARRVKQLAFTPPPLPTQPPLPLTSLDQRLSKLIE